MLDTKFKFSFSSMLWVMTTNILQSCFIVWKFLGNLTVFLGERNRTYSIKSHCWKSYIIWDSEVLLHKVLYWDWYYWIDIALVLPKQNSNFYLGCNKHFHHISLKISRFLIVFNKIERIFQLYGQSMWQRKHDIAS